MIRVLLRAGVFFALLLLVGMVVELGTQEPGSIVMQWYGYEVETSAVLIALVFGAVIVFVYFFARLMAWLDNVPAQLWKGRERKRQDQGFHYLLEGMDAIAAGESKQARKLVDKAARLLPNQSVVHVLQAETARREGDHATAISHFEHLSKSAGSNFLGLKGLTEEAIRQGDIALAEKLVQQALALRPRSAWALERALQIMLSKDNVYNALDVLPRLKRAEMPSERQAFLTACMRHAQAQSLFENHQPEQAIAALNKGIRACPDFVPLYLLGADILIAQGAESRAMRMLAEGWQQCPRHELLDRWMAHYGPDYGKDFVNQALKMVKPLKGTLAGDLAIAEVYVRAHAWQKAGDVLAPLAKQYPNRRVYALLAQVEDGLEPSSRAAHQWLKMALNAAEYTEPAGHVDAFRAWAGRIQVPAAVPAERTLSATTKSALKFLTRQG